MSEQGAPNSPTRSSTHFIRVDYATATTTELIDACTGGDSAAWREFMRRYHSLIAITACRGARRWGDYTSHTIDDLIQETYLKLCASRGRALREFQFEHDDAIFGFLKVVTTNVVNDYFKALHANRRGGNRVVASLEGSEADNADNPIGLTAPERSILAEQVDACLLAAAPAATRHRDRTIFWLYYRQGLTAKEIASLPRIGLTLKGVESTLHRLLQTVRSQLTGTRTLKTNIGCERP